MIPLNLNGITDLPAGTIAAIVTSLEMTARPAMRPPVPAGLDLEPVPAPDLDWYLGLFARIGEPWLWFSRRLLPRESVRAIIHDAQVAVYRIRLEGREVGLVELDGREPGVVEVAYFGFTPEATGLKLGPGAMALALDIAFARKPTRVWVHTCTLDHPAALKFYQRCGFRAFKRMIEVVPDPRLSGVLPLDAAPDVPILRPALPLA